MKISKINNLMVVKKGVVTFWSRIQKSHNVVGI